MIKILNLFGKSPFFFIFDHAKKLEKCIMELDLLFDASRDRDKIEYNKRIENIFKCEEELEKSKARFHDYILNKIYTSYNKKELIEVFDSQDKLANMARSIAKSFVIKQLFLPKECKDIFKEFLLSSLDSCRIVIKVIKEATEHGANIYIIRNSVAKLIKELKRCENISDKNYIELCRKILENEIITSENYLWLNIIKKVNILPKISYNLLKKFSLL